MPISGHRRQRNPSWGRLVWDHRPNWFQFNQGLQHNDKLISPNRIVCYFQINRPKHYGIFFFWGARINNEVTNDCTGFRNWHTDPPLADTDFTDPTDKTMLWQECAKAVFIATDWFCMLACEFQSAAMNQHNALCCCQRLLHCRIKIRANPFNPCNSVFKKCSTSKNDLAKMHWFEVGLF